MTWENTTIAIVAGDAREAKPNPDDYMLLCGSANRAKSRTVTAERAPFHAAGGACSECASQLRAHAIGILRDTDAERTRFAEDGDPQGRLATRDGVAMRAGRGGQLDHGVFQVAALGQQHWRQTDHGN